MHTLEDKESVIRASSKNAMIDRPLYLEGEVTFSMFLQLVTTTVQCSLFDMGLLTDGQ